MSTEYKCMQQKRGIEADWISSDPVLKAGEIGWVSDKGYMVVGDGSTVFTNLPTFIAIRDTAANLATAYPTPVNGLLLYATDTGKLYVGDGATAYANLTAVNGPTYLPTSGNITFGTLDPLEVAAWYTTGSTGVDRLGYVKFTLEFYGANTAFFDCLWVASSSNAPHIGQFTVLHQVGDGSLSLINNNSGSTLDMAVDYTPANTGQTFWEGVVTQARITLGDGTDPFSWSI